MTAHSPHLDLGLSSDPELASAIAGELRRQQDGIELIASENIVSRLVLEAQGSILTNKTVEGLPYARYYGGANSPTRSKRSRSNARRNFSNAASPMCSRIRAPTPTPASFSAS